MLQMYLLRKFSALALMSLFAASLAACEDTWEGMKEDTGQNMESTGEAIEGAGEDIQN